MSFEKGDKLIEKDKILHLIAGFIIALFLNIWFVVIAGILKEIYDYFNPKKHTVEFLDFVFTVLGGLLVLLIR